MEELLEEAWICNCITLNELYESFADMQEIQNETYNEDAWLRQAEYHPQVAEEDEAIWY